MSPTSYQTAPPRGEADILHGRTGRPPRHRSDQPAPGRRPPGYSVWAVGGGGGGEAGSAAFGGGGGGGGAAEPAPAAVAVGAAAADSGARVIWPCSDSCACSEVTSCAMSASVVGVDRPVLVA